jgi:phosphoribosyl-AMP cyclohydrolase
MVDNIEVMEISASVYDDVVAIIEDIDQRSNELNVDDLSKLLNTLITLCEARDINVPLAIKRVVKKMVYRHPHVFDKPKHIDLDESNKIWVKMKKREKMEENRSLDIDFEKRGGRVPVVLKSLSGRVVSLTDIDSEGLTQVLDSKKFDGVDVREMLVDCDQDALTITGPFKSSEGGFAKIPDISALGELESDPDKVYTVAIQDKNSNQILIVGYANLMAITETLETGNATLWSTSRNELWTKGKGSGNVLSETEVSFCANNNTFLYRVNPAPRGACHTINLDLEERESCFYRAVDLGNGQNQLTFLEE